MPAIPALGIRDSALLRFYTKGGSMTTEFKLRFCSVAAVLMFSSSIVGCAALDRSSVQASSGSPESAQVAEIDIPYDPSLPRFVVAVENLSYSPESQAITADAQRKIYVAYRDRVSESIAAQLTSALSNVGNISVVDKMGVKKTKDGMIHTRLNKGEKGPYIIRGTITEFNEVADASSRERGGSLGWLGLIMGVTGAVSGKSGLGWTGAGIAAANPTYVNKTAERKGVVAIDLTLVDGRTGRVVRAFKASGTFAAKSAVTGMSLFGIGGKNTDFAQSSLGQATRIALNDAAKRTIDALRNSASVQTSRR
jgi:curli biogenesis system outer membrane secretion channel CsgG